MDVPLCLQAEEKAQNRPEATFINHDSKSLTFEFPKILGDGTKKQCLDLMMRINVLQNRLSKLEQKYHSRQQSEQLERKPKKLRRKNSEISKHLKCIAPGCKRKYGSITSLKLHLRQKHGIKVKKRRLKEEIITINT